MKNDSDYDCIVIGGGPAGLMAAIEAATAGGRIAILDRNNLLCKKLRITGKGRCNITNDCDFETLIANIPNNPKFLFSAFKHFPFSSQPSSYPAGISPSEKASQLHKGMEDK